MTATPGWEARNDAYLAAGLAWLRARLSRDRPGDRPGDRLGEPGGASDPSGEIPEQGWWERDGWDGDTAGNGVGPPPALELLGERLGLSRFERLTLLLCAAMEFDPAMGSWCAGAAGQTGVAQPTFALALSLLPEPAWDALSPQRPLRYWRLVEVHQGTGQPLVSGTLRADERIVNFLKGLNELDDRLDHLVRPVSDVLGALPPSQEAAVLEGLAAWTDPATTAGMPLIEVLGADPTVRRGLASAMARRAGLLLYELLPIACPEPDSISPTSSACGNARRSCCPWRCTLM